MSTFARFSEHPEAGACSMRRCARDRRTRTSSTGRRCRQARGRTHVRALAARRRARVPSRPVRARRPRRDDPHRRDPRAAPRPAHAPVRSRPARLPHLSADLMNEDAADALLKDLEEPPPYAVIVLVADDLGPIPETIRSRCQLVPFRRLSERAVRDVVDVRAPELDDESRAPPRTRCRRPARPARAAARPRFARAPRRADRAGARAVYHDRRASIRPTQRRCCSRARARVGAGGERARGGADRRARPVRAGCRAAGAAGPARRRARGAPRPARGARGLVPRPRRRRRRRGAGGDPPRPARATCARTPRRERILGAERAAEAVRQLWRELEELNLSPQLALEALFVRITRELAA